MTRLKILAATALAVTALGAGAAQADQTFSDTFNAENGGVASNPYTTFANFTVLAGAVTLEEGTRCAGGSGGCVGLDGHGGDGGTTNLQMSQFLNYSVGSTITLTYEIAGNHADCSRCAADDDYESGFGFSGANTPMDNVVIDGMDQGPVPNAQGFALFGNGLIPPFNAPFTTHTISFVAADAGSVGARFQSFSTDGVGPILDNVTLTVTGGQGPGVPEPAAWALMILGFGASGAMLRRQRRAFAA